MVWTAPTPPPLADSADTGALRPILQGYLDAMRWTLLDVCAGLTAEQLCLRSVPPSSLSLLGLVRHMTKVERYWLRIGAAGEDVPPLFGVKDSDFDDTDESLAPQALLDLQAEWARCDAAVADLSMDHELDHHGDTVSLGLVYVHLVHEYARHNGHADLLRQSIDGVTGR